MLSAASALLKWRDGDTANNLWVHQDAHFDTAIWIIGKFDAKAKQLFASVVFVVDQLDSLDIALLRHC